MFSGVEGQIHDLGGGGLGGSVGATVHRSAWASHCDSFSSYSAWPPSVWAWKLWLPGSRAQFQQMWPAGLVAPQHVGSSWTRN